MGGGASGGGVGSEASEESVGSVAPAEEVAISAAPGVVQVVSRWVEGKEGEGVDEVSAETSV